jgi:hypothetical protein
MSDQQTEVDYGQQHTPQHGNGEYHHAPPAQADIPATLKPTLKLSEPTPRPSRSWPLAARLAVAVLVIGLATVAALSLMSIRTVTARANQAGQQAAAESVSLAAMGRALSTVQAKVAAPAPRLHLPASLAHYGVCVSFSRNTGNGDLVDVNLTTPSVSAGSYSCPQGGSLVSVVPAP